MNRVAGVEGFALIGKPIQTQHEVLKVLVGVENSRVGFATRLVDTCLGFVFSGLWVSALHHPQSAFSLNPEP